MSEDEAFIRSIVDNPGDDTPRLVYADWLDDRSDPRGTYLRAEHEWAATHDPSERDTLRQLAKTLDPVWVARVSRPPIGVCFDSAKFVSSGPSITDRDVNQFETTIGLPMTGDYRAFLLNTNGGVPWTSWATNRDWINSNQCFYSLDLGEGLPERRSLLHRSQWFRSWLPSILAAELWDAGREDSPWCEDSLPIGDTGQDFTLFYAVRGKYAGRLHLHDYTGDWCRFGYIAGPHGPPTLPEFLHRLTIHGHTLPDTYPTEPLQEFWKP